MGMKSRRARQSVDHRLVSFQIKIDHHADNWRSRGEYVEKRTKRVGNPREEGFAPAFLASSRRVKPTRDEGGGERERETEKKRETRTGTFVEAREQYLSSGERERGNERDIERRHRGLAVSSRSRRTKTHRCASFCISPVSQRSPAPPFPRSRQRAHSWVPRTRCSIRGEVLEAAARAKDTGVEKGRSPSCGRRRVVCEIRRRSRT